MWIKRVCTHITTVDGYHLNSFPTFPILSIKLCSFIFDPLESEKVLDLFHIEAFLVLSLSVFHKHNYVWYWTTLFSLLLLWSWFWGPLWKSAESAISGLYFIIRIKKCQWWLHQLAVHSSIKLFLCICIFNTYFTQLIPRSRT
jgi:hypothetical protein